MPFTNDVTDELTDEGTDTGSGVGTAEGNSAGHAADPPPNRQESESRDPALRSGVGMIGSRPVADLHKLAWPLVPPHPRSTARLPPVPTVRPSATAETASATRPPKDALVSQSNLANPRSRPNAPLTTPATPRALPGAVSVPKEPRLPADLASAPQCGSRRDSNHASISKPSPKPRPEEESTHTYTEELIGELLQSCMGSPVDAEKSAADGNTRVGEIPIEELITARCPSSNKRVGHEEVTQVYDFALPDTKSEVTSPGMRARLSEVPREPRVVVKPEPSKSRLGWGVLLMLVLAAGAVGWVCRAPVGRQVQKLHNSLTRGISAAIRGNVTGQETAAANAVFVSISVSPADATVTLDGTPVTNPCVIQRRSDKLTHGLVAAAPRHVSLQRNVQFDRDLTVVLALAPEPAAQSAAPSTKETGLAATTAPAPATIAAAAPEASTRAKAASQARNGPIGSKPARLVSNCRPPYTIDVSGIKTFKPECL